ncbi:glycosyltransferase [Pontibacter sp. FD36]|uniref:glycosyltransferase n=1 Tax=Pontibacter sp. FD36 TaxID=2789860 RepID=UPI0018AA0ADD|nr:glycosyltransferase [Pontibacter sp. FD36]MBF8964585.1 glycosyltransferase [Pontibacter sp. FD36]
MSKIKLLLITVRADYGGGPRHVDLLINNISADFKVHVACPDDKPYYGLWQRNQHVNGIFNLPHRKFKTSALLALSKFIKENSISVVHSHGKGAGVYSRFLKILNPALKVVHTFHGVHTQEYGKVAKMLYYGYENAAKHLTDKFINVSYGEGDICVTGGFCQKEKQTTIYNGVPDLSTLTKANGKSSAETFEVVSISRFDFSKHMQLALKIAALLHDHKHIKFIWVGDGPDKLSLEKQAESDGLTNIVFTGFTDNPEKYLQSAKLYLSTSRWEGLPLSLVEAASLSIPIVATNVTGNNEVVQHGVNGFLYQSDSPQDAADAIIKLIQNQALLDEFSNNSRRIYEDKFTVDLMVNKTELVYKT